MKLKMSNNITLQINKQINYISNCKPGEARCNSKVIVDNYTAAIIYLCLMID